MEKHPKHIRVVQTTSSLFPTSHLPDQASGIDDSPVHDGTRNVPEQTDGELYEPQGHGLVPGVDASQDQQHGPHLRGRVYEDEYREQDDVPDEVRALHVAVADGGVSVGKFAVKINLAGVVLVGHAQAVGELHYLPVPFRVVPAARVAGRQIGLAVLPTDRGEFVRVAVAHRDVANWVKRCVAVNIINQLMFFASVSRLIPVLTF